MKLRLRKVRGGRREAPANPGPQQSARDTGLDDPMSALERAARSPPGQTVALLNLSCRRR